MISTRLSALALLAPVAIGACRPGAPSASARSSAPARAERFVNPLVWQRADPHVLRHADGTYYLAATVPEHPWEQVRYWVNEGPAVLWRADGTPDFGVPVPDGPEPGERPR